MCKKLFVQSESGKLKIVHITERTIKFFDALIDINPKTFDGNWQNVTVNETSDKSKIHEFEILKVLEHGIIDPKKCIEVDNTAGRPGVKEYVPAEKQKNILIPKRD